MEREGVGEEGEGVKTKSELVTSNCHRSSTQLLIINTHHANYLSSFTYSEQNVVPKCIDSILETQFKHFCMSKRCSEEMVLPGYTHLSKSYLSPSLSLCCQFTRCPLILLAFMVQRSLKTLCPAL